MIRIVRDSSPVGESFVLSELRSENREKCSWLRENTHPDDKHYNFMLYDSTELIGGAAGYIAYDWYFLELLYIKTEYRGRKSGCELLSEIERFAKQRNLTGIRLETWDFQARGFYEKLGYSVWGVLDDCPPGTKLFLMKKLLRS